MEATVTSMYVVFVAVAAVVLFAVAAAAVGRGDGLEEPFPDMERPYLPDGRVEAADVDEVHFAVSFRGYRMDQVDSVLDRLAGQLLERDRHIARLERMVQTQARQSVMAYAPPRPRVGVDTGQQRPEGPAPADDAVRGGPDAATAAATADAGDTAAEARPAESESTGEFPSVAEEPQAADGTSAPSDESQRNGTTKR